MYYAPIIIPTLCRYDHFKECLDSLNQNTWASYTDVYIGLDYPAKEKHFDGYLKIKRYLESNRFSFKKLVVIKRSENYGADRNNSELRKYVAELYDRYIVSEDDNVFSPYFIEYMDKMLEASKKNNSIIAVCGYSYPVDLPYNDGNVAFMEQSFFSAWGYGIFANDYHLLLKSINYNSFYNYLFEWKKIRRMRKSTPQNYSYLMSALWHKNVPVNDIGISLFLNLADRRVLMPYKSLVKNTGWDGSGLNCHVDDGSVFNTQSIDQTIELKENYCNTVFGESKENEQTINNFFRIKRIELLKADIKYFLMLVGSIRGNELKK